MAWSALLSAVCWASPSRLWSPRPLDRTALLKILGRFDTQGGVTERDLIYLQSLMTEQYANGDVGMPVRGL